MPNQVLTNGPESTTDLKRHRELTENLNNDRVEFPVVTMKFLYAGAAV